MKSPQDYLKVHLEAYPFMEPQDLVKLIYQGLFGVEHLLKSPQGAKDYLYMEYEELEASCQPLFEEVSEAFIRVNLGAWKKRKIPLDWLFSMFFNSAAATTCCEKDYLAFLEKVEELECFSNFKFSRLEWRNFLASYLASGPGAAHHSESYRERAKPHYRLLKSSFKPLLPLLGSLALLLKDRKRVILTIDGRSGSGKTSLARELAEITGASLISMDDFFLPGKLRTKKRLEEPGGNIHYERFIEEVLEKLKETSNLTYRAFDCQKMDYGEERSIVLDRLLIVEGAYSQHPKFGPYMDYRVFCDITEELQKKRILERNGQEALEVFLKKWIPLEEAYIASFSLASKADYTIKAAD